MSCGVCSILYYEVPVGRAVVLQYSSCFVSRQSADLHQLSGKHFSHRLTLQGKKIVKPGLETIIKTTSLIQAFEADSQKYGQKTPQKPRRTLFLTAPWLNSAKDMREQEGSPLSSSSLPPSPSSSLERQISVRF